jgi:hypothetical protein
LSGNRIFTKKIQHPLLRVMQLICCAGRPSRGRDHPPEEIISMNVKTLFFAAAVTCALVACKKDEAPATDAATTDAATTEETAPATDAMPADTAPAADAAPADAATTDTAAMPAADAAPMAADSTGVAECDDYLTKYMACVNDKVPAASRAAMQQGIDQAKAGWVQAAATPEGKAGLAQACKAASDAAKASMKAFGCEM